ncbi:hypothetical protein KBD45_07225, partial [Candidatus Dojkabacteria bacterium]|nr:hypothetical protein [Candidatus Dojkabacteria bacterium]
MSISFKVVNDFETCMNIWNQITTIKTLYDSWDMRIAFFNNENQLHFIIALDDDKLVGLLPLQKNIFKGYLEFFGGNFMENNRIFVIDGYEHLRRQLVDLITEKALLRSILPEEEYIQTLPFDDYTYKLNLSSFLNINDYFDSVNKKLRKNFRRALNSINDMKPNIVFNSYNNLDLLIDLNKKVHGVESLFNDGDIYSAFHKLLNSNLKITMISTEFDNKPQSVTFGVEFAGIYYALLSGANREIADGLGT